MAKVGEYKWRYLDFPGGNYHPSDLEPQGRLVNLNKPEDIESANELGYPIATVEVRATMANNPPYCITAAGYGSQDGELIPFGSRQDAIAASGIINRKSEEIRRRKKQT